MSAILHPSGLTAIGGTNRFVSISNNDNKANVPHQDFTPSRVAGALESMAGQGVLVLGPQVKELLEKISELKSFPLTNAIDRPGCVGSHYGLPNGDVYSPPDVEKPTVLYEKNSRTCAQSGTLKAWKMQVAAPLAGQSLLMFAIMSAFVAPLLSLGERPENIAFEIVGAKGTGKRSLRMLMASVVGSPVAREGAQSSMIPFDTVLSALDATLAEHADMPIIVEETGLCLAGESEAKISAKIKPLCFALGASGTKDRHGSLARRSTRFVCLSSGVEPISSSMGTGEVALIAAERILTVPIDRFGAHGVFDSIPEGYTSGSDYMQTIIAAAVQHHGTAYRHYVQELVNHRARDEAGLRRRISKLLARFRKNAKVDANDGSAVRVADAFGYVYVAAVLAVEYGALPKSYNNGPVVLACYARYLGGRGKLRSFEERLTEIVDDSDTVRLDHPTKRWSKKQLREAWVIVTVHKARNEVWIPAETIHRVFPDWASLKRQPDVRRHLITDKTGHLSVKRTIGKRVGVRVYCFALEAIDPNYLI